MALTNPADFLPTPTAILPLDYETLLTQWIEQVAVLWPEYDVLNLEFDPGVIVAQAMSYIRLLDRADINDAYRALRLSMATGSDLVGLAADRGVTWLTYREAANGLPEVKEPYESLRLRTWLKMQTWGTGSPLGIEFHARTRALDNIADAHVIDYPGDGYMDLVLLRPSDEQLLAAGYFNVDDFDFDAVISDVGAYVMDRSRRPGSCWINTMASTPVTVNRSVTLFIRQGASKALNIAAAETQWRDYMRGRRRIGIKVSAEAEADAIITRDIVDYNPVGSFADVAVTEKQAAEAGTFTATAEYANE